MSLLSRSSWCPRIATFKDKSQVVKIVFGYPSPGLLEESKKGNVVLGGCCPRPGIEFHCKACKKEFGTFWKECDNMDSEYSDVLTVTLEF